MDNKKLEAFLALQEINLNAASAQDADGTLSSVVGQAVALSRSMCGALYLLNADTGLLACRIGRNLPDDLARATIAPGQGIAGLALQTGQPQRADRFGPGCGPVIAVPIAWDGQTRGVLALIRAEDDTPFRDENVPEVQVLANQAAIALKSAHLLSESQTKTTQLTTLNDVNRVISATLDREASLRLVAEKAVDLLQAEAGSIFLVDDAKNELIFEIALGPTGINLVGARMPIDSTSIAGTIAETRRPLIVNDVARDARWNTSFDEATDFRTRDILGVPMLAFNRVVGVIEAINKKNRRRFSDADLEMLTLFAGQAAIALVNAQRFTQTDQALASRVRELNTLELIDRDLNATLNLQAVLSLTLSNTMDFLGAPVGLIAIKDDDDRLLFKEMVGVASKYKKHAEIAWPVGQGIVGKVAVTGHPMRVAGEHVDNFASDGRSTGQLCVPIPLEDRIIGVISLERSGDDPFSADDQAFATRLASHAALAIQNARLFEAVQAANQAKTEFMSVTSHEMKIPMTSIKGYARMLELMGGDSFSDQQKQFLQIISANVDRMDRLVSDLLDVSRIEAGRIRLDMTDVAFGQVIEDVLQSLDGQIKAKNLQLAVDVAADLPPVRADYGRMVQIMTNLISNAYKYTPEGGRIEVAARPVTAEDGRGPQVRVSVADTGFGISEEDQANLFQKFFRASDQNIRDVPGTGLGLSITKSMVELHGGEMWFESELGQGSTFGFDLPVAAPDD